MSQGSTDLLSGLLRDVSRSFYLTLRALPGSIRSQVGLAYLLARASDTIADTDAIPREERLELLEVFRKRVAGESEEALEVSVLVGNQSSRAERQLLTRLEEALGILRGLQPEDLRQVRQVLETIISGQSLDLTRFGEATVKSIVALQSADELDDYTYRVAGCVGEFWTRMCLSHALPRAAVDESFLLASGIRFGKGLQLVNILRDVPADLRIGRCYLPEPELAKVGLRPVDLLDPRSESLLRPVYTRYLAMADQHLEAGWEYTTHLPWSQVRLRLACAWPILIGVQTLSKLRCTQILEPGQRVKISRRDVRKVLARSVLWYAWPSKWSGLLNAHRQPSKHVASSSIFR